MKRGMCWGLALWLLLTLRGSQPPWPWTGRTELVLYFPQTGHAVQGILAAYFESQGGVATFGQPLTGEIVESGLTVQYFEKARLEVHPKNPVEDRVQLGLLGEVLGRREPPLPFWAVPPAFDRSGRYYPPTGHTLRDPFLAYFDAHGGVERFGYPLSEAYELDGAMVQDFQRTRLIWQEGRMTIPDWGREVFLRGSSPTSPSHLSPQ